MIAVQAETARLTTAGMPAAGAQRLSAIGDTARAALTEMRRLLGRAARGHRDRWRPNGSPSPACSSSTSCSTRQGRLGDRASASSSAAPGRPRPRRRAGRLPHRPGGAHQRQAARAGRGRRRGVALRRGRAAAARSGTTGPAPARLRFPLHGHAAAGGHGLLGMRERAAAVGGELRTGAAHGGGFLVEATLPPRRRRRHDSAGRSAAGHPDRCRRRPSGGAHRFAALLDTQPDFAVAGTAGRRGEAVGSAASCIQTSC